MDIQQVVREVTVRGQVQGMDRVARAYDDVATSSEKATSSLADNAKEAAGAEAAINRLGVQLQANFQQQQRFNDMIVLQANASQAATAANDNAAKSYSVMGIEVAEAANHLRTAAGAAYAFSPAFRGVVNAMAAPTLRIAATSLTTLSTGIVLATNVAGKGLIELGLAAARSSSALTPLGASIAQAGASMAAFNPTVANVANSILGRFLPAVLRFLPIIGQLLLLKDAIMLVVEAWELGGKKLEEYRQIAEKAAAVDLSAAFYQRIAKAAGDAKLPVDELTTSLKNLAQVTAEKLGGSDFQNRLDKLVEAGNFKGNTGVGQLALANTTEEKLRAIVSLTDQAFAKGERLAALDLTSKFLSPAAQAALVKDSEYLHNMLAAADRLNGTELISDADIGRALDLERRYDAAVKILEQRWHPIQDLLTSLGIKMREAWVGIVEAIAQAFDAATKLVAKIGEIPQTFWDYIKKGANVAATGVAAVAPTFGPVGTAIGLGAGAVAAATRDQPVKETTAYGDAVNRLAAGLKNYNTVAQAVAQTNAVQSAVFKDTSKKIDETAKKTSEAKDQYDRARDAIEKHTARMDADRQSVGLGAGALEEARSRAVLWTAALQAGIPVVGEVAKEIDRLAKGAGEAADKLAKARVASRIEFSAKTAFLSQEDVAIARELYDIYGNDVPKALASTEAAQLRVVSASRQLSDGFREVGQAVFTAFATGKNATEALISSLDSLANKLANSAFDNLLQGALSGNLVQMGIGGLQAGASALISMFTGDMKAKKALEDAQRQWANMTRQVTAFNLAAAGVNIGPLTQELQSLYETAHSLAEAAVKAKDYAAQDQIGRNLERAMGRIIGELGDGADILSPLQKAIKDTKDEAAGLQAFLNDIGYGSYAGLVTEAASKRIEQIIANYRDSMTTGLAERLNTANGQNYLNDAARLIKQHQADLTDAADLGNDPALLAQISATFGAEVQKIVQDAGLVGDKFTDFMKLFPDLAGVVHQATVDITGSIKAISQYLESLGLGSNSILSPEDQLKLAQENFSRQLGLAQGGDSDALGSITQYAQQLLDQAKSFYASSAGYTDIYRSVTSQLGGLTGVSGYSAVNTGLSSASLVSPTASLPTGVTNPVQASAAANDNGQYFTQQTQALVQAISATTQAQITTLQDGFAKLSAKLDRVAAAIEDSAAKPMRPRQRATG